jgi:hypothetical protein
VFTTPYPKCKKPILDALVLEGLIIVWHDQLSV